MSNLLYRVYFGGTFDPPHRGHFDMLNALLRDEWTQQVLVTPTHLNPIKSASTQVGAFGDASRRQHWVELWLDETRKANPAAAHKIQLNLAEIEAGRADPRAPSFTVDSIRALIANKGQERWAMVLGSDSLPHLEKWKDIDTLLQMLDGVWVFRRGAEANPLQKVPERLRALSQWRLFGQTVFDVSSSEIRGQIDAAQSASQLPATLVAALLPSVCNALK